MTDFVEKLITNKCYIIIDSKVTQSWGGKVYNYHWYGYLSTKKQLKNLEREQEKEGTQTTSNNDNEYRVEQKQNLKRSARPVCYCYSNSLLTYFLLLTRRRQRSN